MQTPEHTNKRWFPILGLVLVATTINYLDRTVFQIARPLFSTELGFDARALGLLGSAFGYSYAFSQIPGGIFLDRFGTRLTYFISLITWSIFTALQGMASSVAALFGYRLGLGFCEAPCFPANSRVLATWFPQGERARANAVYAVGQYAGIAFLSVPLFWIADALGWRMLFILAGVLGALFGFIWFRFYREPKDFPGVSRAELDHIEAGGGLAPKVERTPFSWENVGKLLKKRQIIVASLAQFTGNTVLVFFTLDFVNYLATERQMAWMKAGIFVAFPYMAAAAGVLMGGLLSDFLLKKTGSPNIGRKVPIVMGLLLASTIISANYVPMGNDTLVISIMSLAFFGQGMTNLGWTVISDIAPKNLIGLTGGLFNFITNLATILTPTIIGFALFYTGSYIGPLVYVGVMPLIGALLYIFALGDIKRLDVND